jgi:hypothetical protein
MKAQPYETADAIAGLPSLRTNKLLPSGTSTSHFPNLPMRSNTAALLFERARLEVQDHHCPSQSVPTAMRTHTPLASRTPSIMTQSQFQDLLCHAGKKEPRSLVIDQQTGLITGDDLLSQDLSSHYHRRTRVSLPGSEWDRVVPLCYGHQRSYFIEYLMIKYDL